jgi:hypothetical protein
MNSVNKVEVIKPPITTVGKRALHFRASMRKLRYPA